MRRVITWIGFLSTIGYSWSLDCLLRPVLMTLRAQGWDDPFYDNSSFANMVPFIAIVLPLYAGLFWILAAVEHGMQIANAWAGKGSWSGMERALRVWIVVTLLVGQIALKSMGTTLTPAMLRLHVVASEGWQVGLEGCFLLAIGSATWLLIQHMPNTPSRKETVREEQSWAIIPKN